MGRAVQVSRLELNVRERAQAPRAEHLIAEALRTASLPGIPQGARVAVRRLDLGRLSLREPAQALALRVDRLVAALPRSAVHVAHPAAAEAAVVWASDGVEALAALAEAVAAQRAAAWFWPRLVPGWRQPAGVEAGLARILHHAAALLPDPHQGVRQVLLAARGQRTRLAAAMDEQLARRLAPAALPAQAVAAEDEPPSVPAAPPELVAVARAWGAAAVQARALAAIWLASPGTAPTDAARRPAAVAAQLAAWHRPAASCAPPGAASSRSRPAVAPVPFHPAAAAAAPLPVSVATVAARAPLVDGPAPPPPSTTAVPATPARPGPEAGDPAPVPADAATAWDGIPSRHAGAVLLIALLQRAAPQAEVGERAAALLRLARQAGARRDDPAVAWLALPMRRPAEAVLRRTVLAWLRRADRAWRAPGERRLSLRRLVRRPGLVRATATHLDVTFPLAASDIRVRRLGLDLDPGWVPWLGRVVGIHYRDQQAGLP